MTSGRGRGRPVLCSTCQTELVKGSCPTHGLRNKDGSSRDELAAARANKGARFPPEPLTHQEVGALLGACTTSATGRRNAALISLLYRSGLRISEALALYPKDVDLDAGTVTVLHGKGDKRRTVGIDTGTIVRLRMWMDSRQRLGITRHRRMFCTLKGGRAAPLESGYVRHLLPRLGRKAGIEKRVHAHGLRHSHAYELTMEGTPLPAIQAQLGHSNAAVTSQYIQHIAPADVIATIHARPPWDTDD